MGVRSVPQKKVNTQWNQWELRQSDRQTIPELIWALHRTEEYTHHDFSEMLAIYIGIDYGKMWAPAAMKRDFVHDLPFLNARKAGFQLHHAGGREQCDGTELTFYAAPIRVRPMMKSAP